ncbi:lipoate-protein ligase [Aureococcus anophagefferens]|nr:lipoate-protein ligase [Aureococcus anophagefferens]
MHVLLFAATARALATTTAAPPTPPKTAPVTAASLRLEHDAEVRAARATWRCADAAPPRSYADDDFVAWRVVDEGAAGPDERELRGGHAVYATKEPVVTAAECDALVAEAQASIDAKGADDPRRVIGEAAPMHRDASLVSLNVVLTEPASFAGGGTYFEGLERGALHAPGRGCAVCHNSGVQHAGHAVAAGTRWVLVLFVLADGAPQLALAGQGPRRRAARRRRPRRRRRGAARGPRGRAGGPPAPPDARVRRAARGDARARSLAAAGRAYRYCAKARLELGRLLLEDRRPRAALRAYESALADLDGRAAAAPGSAPRGRGTRGSWPRAAPCSAATRSTRGRVAPRAPPGRAGPAGARAPDDPRLAPSRPTPPTCARGRGRRGGENQSSSDEDSSSDHGLDSDPEFETTSGAKSTRRGAQKKKPTGPLCTDISFDPYNSPNLDRVEEDDDVDLTREGLMALLHKSIELNDEVERIGKEAGAYGLKFVQQHWQDYLVKFGICLDVNQDAPDGADGRRGPERQARAALDEAKLRAAPWRASASSAVHAGGTVVVGGGTVVASLVVRKDDAPCEPFPRDIMAWTEGVYAAAFGSVLKPGAAFSLRADDYVLGGDRKVGGNAQCISKDKWIHHTSFLWDYDPEHMAFLAAAKRPVRGDRDHGAFLSRLRDHVADERDRDANRGAAVLGQGLAARAPLWRRGGDASARRSRRSRPRRGATPAAGIDFPPP